MPLWSRRRASQQSIAALEMAAGLGAASTASADAPVAVPPTRPTRPAPACGTPLAPPVVPAAPTLPPGAVVRSCALPELHEGWWHRADDALPGESAAEVVCGLCEYPGRISAQLRALLADPPDPATPAERAELAACLLAWGAAHDYPRLPLAPRAGAGSARRQPFLWLAAGADGWRTFVGANPAALLRSALSAAEEMERRGAAVR